MLPRNLFVVLVRIQAFPELVDVIVGICMYRCEKRFTVESGLITRSKKKNGAIGSTTSKWRVL